MIKDIKVKSFTILELMIALLVSSLVLTLVYLALVLFNGQWINFQGNSVKRNDYLSVKKILKNDLENGILVVSSIDSNVEITNGQGNVVKYEAANKYVTRTNGAQIDSFKCTAVISDIKYLNDSVRSVTSFVLSVSINNQVIPALFTKNYTAKELMKMKAGE